MRTEFTVGCYNRMNRCKPCVLKADGVFGRDRPSLIATSHGGRVPRWSFAPSMISATPRSLLDALDGQREDRLHRGSAAINVQQLPDRKSTRLNSSHSQISYA